PPCGGRGQQLFGDQRNIFATSVEPGSEWTYRTQALGPPHRSRVRRFPGPGDRVVDGDSRCHFAGPEPIAEPAQPTLRCFEFKSQAASLGQIGGELIVQTHRGTCPKGTIKSRKDFRSTLA